MSYKTVNVVLASAVASAGTFTASYPDNTSAGDFAPFGHYLMARGLGGAKFTQNAGQMSISFGASSMTVTYNGATSLPAGSNIVLQLNMRGQDDGMPWYVGNTNRLTALQPVRIDFGSPDTADADGIVESQNLTSAGVYSTLAFNGVYGDPYSNDYAVLDVPRNVVAAWTGTAILTVTGQDEYGVTMIESSGSGTSFTGKKAFKKITRIATSANITSLTVGTGDVLGFPVYIEKVGQILTEYKDEVVQARTGGKVYLTTTQLEAAVDAAGAIYVVTPVAGNITKAWSVQQGTVTTGGDIAVAVNGSAVTGLTITVANSAVAGEVDSGTPTLNTATAAVAAGDNISFTPGSAFNASADAYYVVEITTTSATNGTLVVGVLTAATATTGDVRGTYDPYAACDGSLSFAISALLADPNYKGVDQYDG